MTKRFLHRTCVAYGSVASSVFQKQLLTPFSYTFCRRWSWEAIKKKNDVWEKKKEVSDLRLQPTSIAEINLRVQFRFVSIPVVPTWHSRAWATLTNAQANLSKPRIQRGKRINFFVFIGFRFIVVKQEIFTHVTRRMHVRRAFNITWRCKHSIGLKLNIRGIIRAVLFCLVANMYAKNKGVFVTPLAGVTACPRWTIS